LTPGDEVLTLDDMTEMVRAAGLRGFHALVRRLGGNPAALLRRQRIATDLSNEEALLPAPSVVRLLEDAASALACPDSGLQLAQSQDIGILGPVAVAIQNAPTIGEALQAASRFLFVHNEGLSFKAVCVRHDEAESAELRYEIQTPRPALARQSFDLMLAGGHLILTLLGGERYRLDAVHLPHKPVAPPSVYWRYFGVKVRFEWPTASLVVSRALFDAPLPRADETLRGLATSFLESNFDRTRMSVLLRVRLELRKSLGVSNAGLALRDRTYFAHASFNPAMRFQTGASVRWSTRSATK
jgi:Arabinose-binding domain of AraC transcription regulator, N-term